MIRIEFLLSMPRNNAWNGRWSGEGKRYSIVRSVKDKIAAYIFGEGKTEAFFWYDFGDGWAAQVSARIMGKGERPKSDGFQGYDWMVQEIVAYGLIMPQECHYVPGPGKVPCYAGSFNFRKAV